MQVTKNITLDLLETGSPVIIKAKQNDRNTRYIAAHLYVGRLDYQVPSGTEIAFRYKKPDGTAGFYDALPDNSPAITVSGNTVTVELVEQVLTVAGCVHCEINMYNAASEKLTTFTFEISVEESVLTDAEIISSDYYNVLTAEIAKALQAVTDATEQAENAAQSAQDAADNAAMSKDWAAGQPVTYSGTPVSIAYAGENRIASITAYGETPQGGTTEDPVALTGISSVKVNDDVNELPIPRPLHKVGDVRDVCRTRVKSVYDKRVVLDGSSDEVFIQTNIIDGWIQIATESDAVIPESTSIVGSIKSSYLKAYAIEEVYSKKYSGISVDSNRRIRLSFKTSEYPDVTSVETARTYLSAHPLTVYYQSTAYYGTNGLDVCLTEYQTDYIESYADESITTAWISSTGALSTGAEVAYVLSSPETYATEPLDFDNAAGPLTVMTGGELEVRMTELIGSRSDVSNNTVAFSEASQDADIASGEKLSVLFGKIKKRFSVLASKVMLKSVFTQVGNPNLLDNSNFTNPVNQRGVGSYTDTWKYCIDRWTLIGKYDVKAHTLTFQADNAIERFGLTLSYMRQGIEGLNIGDKVTLSASAGGVAYSHTITLAADMQQAYNKGPFLFTVEYYSSTNVAWFGIGITSGSVALEWIKAEKGGITTPYVPKGYGAELAECQRYYLRIPNWQMVGSGYVDWEGKHIFIMMPTPSTMRIAPTAVAISGTAYCGDGTTSSYSGTPGAINRPGWVVLDLSGTFTQKNQTATFVMGNTPLELSSDL